MAYRIATDLLDAIRGEAGSSPNREICGLLLGRRGAGGVIEVDAVLPCANVAAQPDRRFEIDPAGLIAVHREARRGGPELVGCYHSHPAGDPSPSRCDAAMAAADGWLWLIVGQARTAGWRAVGNGVVHGRFDPEDRIG